MPFGGRSRGGGFILRRRKGSLDDSFLILEKFGPILDFTEIGPRRKIGGRPQNIFGTNIDERGKGARGEEEIAKK